MNSYLVSLQCAVSHGPEGNSRIILKVTQHTERFCTLMAGKGFLSTVHSRTNLENVHSFNDFVQKKAPEGFLSGVHSQMILTDVHSCMLLNYPKHQIILYTEGSCRYSNQSVLVSCGQ
jgi:hypothetical protein